jgi:ubiquinone/menaquinone biosynthesis C-methylase UbiE
VKLKRLQRNWNEFGRRDPFWAVLTQADKKHNKWDREEFFRTGRDEIDALMTELKQLPAQIGRKRALDFGCGVGRLTQPLADHFAEVVGVDIAPAMLDLARQYNLHGSRCRFVLNETNDLRQLESRSFDLVYSRFVLQHMPPRHIRAYVAELIRVLAPGGLLVFQLPGGVEPPVTGTGVKRVVPRVLVKFFRSVKRRLMSFPRMEEHGMTRNTMVALLQQHGGLILRIADDRCHGADTEGYRYFVQNQTNF